MKYVGASKDSFSKSNGTFGGTTNFNSLITLGVYQATEISNCLNKPMSASTYGVLIVEVSDGYIHQTYKSTLNEVLVRNSYDGGATWGAWQLVITDNPIITTITTGFASGFSGSVVVRKNHINLVQVKGDLSRTTDIAYFLPISTLPIGVRPSEFIVTPTHLLDTSYAPIAGNDSYLSLDSNGSFIVYSVGTTVNARRIVFEFMYYAA